jgi:hypothetical protein
MIRIRGWPDRQHSLGAEFIAMVSSAAAITARSSSVICVGICAPTVSALMLRSRFVGGKTHHVFA